ncbi:MAG: hypothetical protein F4029_14645 [Gammaproteobacteria bacterium]|nr:hypothetical protein [Gammaproteobacteria bacterium]MXY57326.1 hypothetical protein [Gammaproteobacteria bacterium]MYF30091.1 hypothetical protein [Gammaproteobacteria bacterium]MYK47458.1 hypothetical protein [Gammaproteobacteria bacterium]
MRSFILGVAGIAWSAVSGAAGTDGCTPLHVAADLHSAPIEAISGRSLDATASYRVGNITVVRQDVFNPDDPAEARAAFRLANRWHIVTREGVVRELLLFRSGDTVTAATIQETERALRSKSYLYDVRIVANRVCPARGDRSAGVAVIDLIVVTRDVWSLSPELSVTRTGGVDRVRAGVSEINLAGSGSELDLTVFENLDRQGVSASYTDANLGRSRVGIRLRYDDTDDGELLEAGIGRPFYALSVRRSWNTYVLRSSSLQGLYRGGGRTESFRRDYRLAQVSSGWSQGRRAGWVNRLVAGVTLEDWRHAPAPTQEAPVGPGSRRFVYPWMSFHRIEDEYAQVRNVDRVQTTEDVYLGRRYDLMLGYAPDGDGHLVASAEFRDGRVRGDDGLLRYGAHASGYWNTATGQPENAIARVWARYRHRQARRWALILDGEATVTDGLTADQQVLIGGSSGLRGYPNRYQAGTRAYRFTAEERFYTDLYPLRILRIALAGFVDVGRAWGWHDDTEMLANVGVGFRFESTRTNRKLVYHLDVAFPVVDGPGVSGVEVTLTSKRSL